MSKLENFYTHREAAAAIGVSGRVLKRLVAEGIIGPATIVGRSYLYSREDVEKLAEDRYPEGLTYTEIGNRFEKAANTVKTNFRRLGVQPVGWNRRRQAYVFDLGTVRQIAHSLGWLENPKDGSSVPASED